MFSSRMYWLWGSWFCPHAPLALVPACRRLCLVRRRRAADPPAFRTRSARDPHCAPHPFRTCSALVPHLCRICAAFVPHLCRNVGGSAPRRPLGGVPRHRASRNAKRSIDRTTTRHRPRRWLRRAAFYQRDAVADRRGSAAHALAQHVHEPRVLSKLCRGHGQRGRFDVLTMQQASHPPKRMSALTKTRA